MNKIQLLDCTLRDGAYICDSKFGTSAIKGIIKKMQDANADIIECGWLKNQPHVQGTSFFHHPSDLNYYLDNKRDSSLYVVMIDWDRYDLDNLPEYDGKSIDAIRVVFPHGKHREGIQVGKEIIKKGYKVFFQAANTLAYSDEDLYELANEINNSGAECISVVDTFGAMYPEDLDRIVSCLNKTLNQNIKIGFHSHNNQQLAFSNTIHFVDLLEKSGRNIVLDSSLCGMGRGAGNATTELVANYINLKHHGGYDMNAIMDAIDTYMEYFQENYSWGYSTPYFIAGMYQCHVNNIAYLLKNHRTNAQDMRNIIESLSQEDRRKYDYDLLESKYLENQSRIVDDEANIEELKHDLSGKKILFIAPGKTTDIQYDKIKDFIVKNDPIVIGVNAINPKYKYDYLFFINSARYEYAQNSHKDIFNSSKKIILSNIKSESKDIVVNFNRVIKRGWEHFDNAVITCLRLMDKVNVKDIYLSGFDSFKHKYNETYADESLPTLNPDNKWDELNEEIKDMFNDFLKTSSTDLKISFITDSYFKTGVDLND